MKREIEILVLVLILVFSLTACRGKELNLPGDVSTSTKIESELTSESVEKPNVEVTSTYASATTWTSSIGYVYVQTVVEVENTGTVNVYLDDAAYDLEDINGNLITSQRYVTFFPNVIEPGEKAYLCDVITLDEYVDSSDIVVKPRGEAHAARIDRVRYDVTDISIKENKYGYISVLGRIENTSKTEENYVFIVALFFNESGEMIGSDYTSLTEKFSPGEKVGFELNCYSLPDSVTTETIAETVIIAYPYKSQYN